MAFIPGPSRHYSHSDSLWMELIINKLKTIAYSFNNLSTNKTHDANLLFLHCRAAVEISDSVAELDRAACWWLGVLFAITIIEFVILFRAQVMLAAGQGGAGS